MAASPQADLDKMFRSVIAQRVDWGQIGKADLKAAITAADTWADSNQASYNTALPQPFRGQASTAKKTMLLCLVIMKRAGVIRAEMEV